MPYTTVVAGQVITASWGNANVRDQVVTPFSDPGAIVSGIASPLDGMFAFSSSDKTLWMYNGTAWKPVAGPPTAYKTAVETVNNSAVLQNDDDLKINVDANAYYQGELWIAFTSAPAAGLRVDFTAPVGATMESSGFLVVVAGATTFAATSVLGNVSGIVSSGAAAPYMNKFTLVTGANAGTLQFRWAQNAANASNTTVNVGSYLELKRIG